MPSRRIEPVGRRLHAALRSVPSKSVTHRALVAAALGRGTARLIAPLDAEDTRRTRAGLMELGVDVRDEPGAWIVRGTEGRIPGGGTIALAESGTSYRLLTAVAALGGTPTLLDGSERLRQRPGAELFAALRDLGAAVEAAGPWGGLPVRAGGPKPRGGAVSVAAGRSSQFASALLLIGPCLEGGLDLTLEPPAVSLPYVHLTVSVLRAFGARVRSGGDLRFRVDPGGLRGREYRIEGDHSSASYPLAAAALCGGRVRVAGLDAGSVQADAAFLDMLRSLGCRVRETGGGVEVTGSGAIPGFDLDAGHCPDLVPTLAVLALFADGPCRVRGVPHLRFKESDRLAVLAENLNRLGRAAAVEGDSLRIDGGEGALRPATIRTASDHRIAMAFAVAGLRTGLEVDDADCVSKSYPGFWSDLEALTGGPRTGNSTPRGTTAP
jgi:3-phosphoshikimate 1-carboxyvinyltransferase